MNCPKCGISTEVAGYVYGFCNPCAKFILDAAAKRLQRKAKPSVEPIKATPYPKKLADDLKACETAIAALGTALDRLVADDLAKYGINTRDSWSEPIATATARYTRALTDHRLLWSMYRRADKSTPYYDVNAVISPIGTEYEEGPAETPQVAVAA